MSDQAPGTINLWVFIEGNLTDEAFIEALVTSTEAKVKALLDEGITDPRTGGSATGTPTDSPFDQVAFSIRGDRVYLLIGAAFLIDDIMSGQMFFFHLPEFLVNLGVGRAPIVDLLCFECMEQVIARLRLGTPWCRSTRM